MTNPDDLRPQEQIIRVLSPPHCARGPRYCAACAEAARTKRICLLRIFFDGGQLTRPMIEIARNGKLSIHEYDVLRSFSTHDEAIEYARANGVEDVDFT